MKTVLFVPARKGSTGIKGKNLVKLKGKPLINYTLEICNEFPKKFILFVSSDSKKILKQAKNFGFKENYVRPKKLSTSKSNVVDSIIHGIEWLKKEKKVEIEDVILLQPTSPLRRYSDLIKAYKIYKNKKLSSLTAVTKVRENSLGHLRLSKNKQKWKFLYKSKKKLFRRQDFPRGHYILNGSFYFCNYNFLKSNKVLVKENYTYLYETDRLTSVDIDFKSDLDIAEAIIKSKKNNIF